MIKKLITILTLSLLAVSCAKSYFIGDIIPTGKDNEYYMMFTHEKLSGYDKCQVVLSLDNMDDSSMSYRKNESTYVEDETIKVKVFVTSGRYKRKIDIYDFYNTSNLIVTVVDIIYINVKMRK